MSMFARKTLLRLTGSRARSHESRCCPPEKRQDYDVDESDDELVVVSLSGLWPHAVHSSSPHDWIFKTLVVPLSTQPQHMASVSSSSCFIAFLNATPTTGNCRLGCYVRLPPRRRTRTCTGRLPSSCLPHVWMRPALRAASSNNWVREYVIAIFRANSRCRPVRCFPEASHLP